MQAFKTVTRGVTDSEECFCSEWFNVSKCARVMHESNDLCGGLFGKVAYAPETNVNPFGWCYRLRGLGVCVGNG